MDEDVGSALALTEDLPNRLCFFSVPYDLQWLYRTYVFPIAAQYNFVPMTAEDIVARGNVDVIIEAIIARASAVVVDTGSRYTVHQLAVVRAEGNADNTLIISPQGQEVPRGMKIAEHMERPVDPRGDLTDFEHEIGEWFARRDTATGRLGEREAMRLLEMGEFRAAVVSSITLLETTIRKLLQEQTDKRSEQMSLGRLLRLVAVGEVVGPNDLKRVDEWRRVRNRMVHTTEAVHEEDATELVHGVMRLVKKLTKGEG